MKYIFLAKISNDSDSKAVSSHEIKLTVNTLNNQTKNKYVISFSPSDLYPSSVRNISASIIVKSEDTESFENQLKLKKFYPNNARILPLTDEQLKKPQKKKRAWIDTRRFMGGVISFEK